MTSTKKFGLSWRFVPVFVLSLVPSGAPTSPHLRPGETQALCSTARPPIFSGTDQSNHHFSDFIGQVVALTPVDSQCEDTCPLTAVHLRTVYQQLG
jgi:cytochrome oxidase Cu insertion factor (SCO1/SenC/PrrC family)